MAAASSLFSRLHGLFKKSSTAPLPGPPPVNSIFNTQDLSQMVKDFKSLSKYRWFRERRGLYSHAVSRLASAGNRSAIDDILQCQKKYDNIRDESFVMRLISLYGISGMLSHARKLFDEMPQLFCPRSVRSFNCLLKAAVQVGNQQECERIFDGIPRTSSIKPDTVSYNILIYSLCKRDHMDKAVSMVEKMESRGIRPSLATFNTLLDAFYERGSFSDADNIWAVMRDKGIEATTRTYNSKIRGFLLHQKEDDAVVVMEEIGMKADAYTYGHIIQGFCGKGMLEEAVECFEKLLKRKELVPLRSTMEVMVSCAHKVGNAELVMRLLEVVIQQKIWVKKEGVEGALGLILDRFGDEEHMKIVARLKAVCCKLD